MNQKTRNLLIPASSKLTVPSLLNARNTLAMGMATLLLAVSQAKAGLVNGGFELPSFSPGTASVDFALDSTVPGWRTTAPDHLMEFWSDGFNGVTAYEGSQFVELNAFSVASLYQDSTGIPAASVVGFQFAHRGRAGVDVLQLRITDLGADNLPGGTGLDTDTVLFSKQYSDGNTAWGFYTSAGEAPIIGLGNTTRFSYDSISAAGGSPAVGNFLDAADFGIGVGGAPVPEPATALAGIACTVAAFSSRRRKLQS